MLENRGTADYNGLQIKLERRFSDGFSFTGSYSLAEGHLRLGGGRRDRPPAAVRASRLPARALANDRRHMLWINAVYELPFGRDQRFLNDAASRAADAILGGWQLSGINSFVSGAPLSISVPGATLGNGWGTRANLTGDPERGRPVGDQWFNTSAFSAPAQFEYGNSADRRHRGSRGAHPRPRTDEELLDRRRQVHPGPRRGLQRAQQSEPGNPGTTWAPSNFGRILSAGAAGRCSLA